MNSSHPSVSRDNNFNLLRFVAASLVLMTHSFALATGSRMAEPLRAWLGITWGDIAVDVFFVTSGFLVTSSLLARRNLIEFASARILRIYPGLWVVLILTVLVAGTCVTTLSAQDFFSSFGTWKYLLKNGSVLRAEYYLPGVFESNPFKRGVNGSLWTLPTEVDMYFWLAVSWVLAKVLPGSASRNLSLIGTALMIACLFGGISVILSGEQGNHIGLGYMFSAGAMMRMLNTHIPLSFRFAGPMLLAVLASTFNKTTFNIVYTLCIPYLVMYVAMVPSGRLKEFNRFGDYSYGIYIYAFPVQQMLAFFWHGINPYQMIFFSFLITFSFAFMSWHLIEKRALGFKRYFESGRRQQRMQVA